jgi:hypothetical protein
VKPKLAANDIAIGTWEAACVLGVHWVTVARMVEKGMIRGRELASATGSRVFRVYSLEDCEENYAEYLEICRKNGGHAPKHPRTMVHMRHEILERLQNEPARIAFDDAISATEAAAILGVNPSFTNNLASRGQIVGRILWNGRQDSGGSRLWVFSRKSCTSNRDANAALEQAGLKVGRPRNVSTTDDADKKTTSPTRPS